MPRSETAIPNTVTVTNISGTALNLAGLVTVPAGATGLVIDLTKFAGRQAFGDPVPSRREQLWNAIVLSAGAQDGSAALTITATSPTTAITDVDYAGIKMAGAGSATVYGKGTADTTVAVGSAPRTAQADYTTNSRADTVLRTV